jgi:DNA adenine methylase
LKWVGGKGQLLPELLREVEGAGKFGRYHEPFIGGGALFFELARQHKLGRKLAWLSDSNLNLVETYQGVRDKVEIIIHLLHRHGELHSKKYYYQVRANVPDNLVERAARVIYLNKTCYNGLYRENRKGEFNVPFGRYTNPMICDETNLRKVAEVLKRTRLESGDFETVLDAAKPGDLVYFDPPYHPLSDTASFTSYEKNGFGKDSQVQLADVAAELKKRGVKVILSNSWTPFIRRLYREFRIEKVFAGRRVNSRADRRDKVPEVLIASF